MEPYFPRLRDRSFSDHFSEQKIPSDPQTYANICLITGTNQQVSSIISVNKI